MRASGARSRAPVLMASELDARARFTALLKVTKSTFWGAVKPLFNVCARVLNEDRSLGPPPLFS
eukprot:5369877-Prymnesium_polylepis.1